MRHKSLFLLLLAAAGLSAAPLTGSGSVMTLPTDSGSLSPGLTPVITNTFSGFQGTWSAPAAADWIGTFTTTGTYPSSGVTGTTLWDFTTLPNGLPSGTFVRFGDLDNGETFTLRAYTLANVPITSDWLEDAIFIASANPADLTDPLSMPAWNAAAGVYTFTGNVGLTNHTVTITLPTNTTIGYLELSKPDTNNGFGLAAPVPEPATYAITGLGLIAAALAGRRRSQAR